MPRRVDEDNGAASDAVVLWRAGDSSAGQDDGPEACYAEAVSRVLGAACVAFTAAACLSAVEAPVPAPEGIAALIIVQVDRFQGTSVRVVEPFDPSARLVLESGSLDRHTYVLAYDRPLSTYGLRVEVGELVQREAGVPLPPPTRWLEAITGSPLVERPLLDTGRDLPDVRVPGIDCPTLEEEVATRMPWADRRYVTFAGPTGDGGYLLALSRDDQATPPTAAVLTRVDARGGAQLLDVTLSGHAARGFVARDGSSWVVAQRTTPASDSLTPVVCHFRVGGPYDASACRDARGDLGGYPLERLAGYEGDDGRVVLVGMSWDFKLATWTGTNDGGGEWSAWLPAGKWEQSDCNVGGANVSLWVDGPGTGVAAPESGPLVAFDLLGPGPARTRPLFADTSCRGAFARTARGAELFVRVAQVVSENYILTPPDVLWRGATDAAWGELGDTPLTPTGILALGNVVLVPGTAYTLAPLVFDPLRPDLPPRMCTAVSVYNTATSMVDLGGGRVLVAGTPPNIRLLPGYISTWKLTE